MTAPSDEYFAELDTRLDVLINEVAELHPELAMDWPVEYLKAGEYGLSLERLIELLIEHEKHLPRKLTRESVDLAETMQLRPPRRIPKSSAGSASMGRGLRATKARDGSLSAVFSPPLGYARLRAPGRSSRYHRG